MGVLNGLISLLGWGSADFLGALSSRRIGSLLSLFWMQTIGFILVFIYFLFNFSSFNLSLIPNFLILLVLVAFLQTVAYLAFYQGLEKGQVSLVSPLGASWGMVTALLSVIFYGEILKLNQVIAVLLISVGIILISVNFSQFLKAKHLSSFSGVKEGLIAMLGWGISFFLLVSATKTLDWFLPVLIFRFFVITFLAAYIVNRSLSFKVTPRPNILVLLIPIGVLDVIAYLSMSIGLQGSYASIVALIAGAFPLITILLAKIFLKENYLPIK